MVPSRGSRTKNRGFIIPIGGAVRKRKNPVILEKFVELCGGEKAVIPVIATATKENEVGAEYVQLFSDLGAKKVRFVDIQTRVDCKKDEIISQFKDATGIFMTGGNQLRLSTIIGGTPVAQLIRKMNADGVHFAGTSAGAAIIPEHMISGGRSGSTPTPRSVSLSPGLGLTNSMVIDQHFRQRNRLGRLLSAVAYNPFLIGIGIDEDTAIFIDHKQLFEVAGSGAVTVVDPSNIQHSSMSTARRGDAISLVDVKLHVLAEGATYNLNTKMAIVTDSPEK
jgi:cyanophycinase